VQEISQPMSPRADYVNGNETVVVPFSEHVYQQHQRRPQTAHPRPHPLPRQLPEQTAKPKPRRPAPPPPTTRPATAAAVMSRPQTAGSGVKKTQARAKLKRVLGQKQSSALLSAKLMKQDNRGQNAASIEMKYATVKKIPHIKDSFNQNETEVERDTNASHSVVKSCEKCTSKSCGSILKLQQQR